MPTLFEISDDLKALDDLLAECDGDITGAEDAVDKWFAEIGGARDEKLDNYAALIRELDARSAARKEEADRLAKRAKIDAGHARWLKLRAWSFMRQHHIDKLETRRFRLSVVRNGGVLPLTCPDNPEAVPERFRATETVITVDKDAIREALDAGESLPFASYGERGTSLRIR